MSDCYSGILFCMEARTPKALVVEWAAAKARFAERIGEPPRSARWGERANELMRVAETNGLVEPGTCVCVLDQRVGDWNILLSWEAVDAT
jgi:hypothetical protein